MTSSRGANALGQIAVPCDDNALSRADALQQLAAAAEMVWRDEVIPSSAVSEFDHTKHNGKKSGSTSAKRKPSHDEMVHLISFFGPLPGQKTRTRTFYHNTPGAIRSRFGRWFPDFYTRFRYDEDAKCWVPIHHGGNMYKELDDRRKRFHTKGKVRGSKVALSSSRSSGNNMHKK